MGRALAAPAGEPDLRRAGTFVGEAASGRWLFCSAELTALLRSTPEVLGRLSASERAARWLEPEDRPRYLAMLERAQHERRGYRVRYRLRDGEGALVACEEAAEPWQEPDSGRWRFVGTLAAQGAANVDPYQIQDTRDLEEREQRLRAVADGIPLPIVIARIHQPEVLFVNAAAEAAFALRIGPQAEGLRRAYVDPAARRRLVERLLADGAVEGFETELRRADGSTLWGRIYARIIPVAGEQVMLTALTDISERKAAQDLLEEREEQFRTIAESVPVGLVIARPEPPDVLYVNGRATETLGLQVGSSGEAITGLYADPQDRERLIGRLTRDGRVDNLEVLLRHASGRPLWALLSARQMTFRGVPAMLTTMTDISERRAVEQALRDSEQRFRVLAEAHPVPLVIVGVEDAVVMLASPACEPFFGIALKDFVGASILPYYVDPEDRWRIMAAVREAGRLSNYEVEMRRADGTPFWVSFDSGLITYEGRLAVVAAYVDLTEKRAADAELERQREALLQSEKMSALGSLLASVAHELNNPLSVVVGQAVLLQEQTAGSAEAERAAKIRAAADRCARIVRTFLAMARSKPPERRQVGLRDAIQAALDLAAYGLRATGIRLQLEIDDQLPPIWVDADQLHQVLTNLVINAKQALQMVEHERRLVIRAQRDDEHGLVRLEVEDSGPGIDPALHGRVFEPFFTTKPQGVGTGIGLSVSRRIVTAHGGSIEVTPGTLGGARFTVRLPLGHPVAKEPPRSEEQRPSRTVRGRALVVDDEPDLADLLAEILAQDGFEVEVADGGRSALDRLAGRDYDLVISDLRMPDMDGPALYRVLERDRPELAARMLFVTGDTLSPDASAFIEAVGRPVIEKPFDAGQIKRLAATAVEEPADPRPA